MPREDTQQGLMPSILDRLIDPDASGTSWRRGYGLEQMVEAVHRDLEDLLNTRQSYVGPKENGGLSKDLVEVGNSIVAYGLPDLASLSAVTPKQREEIGRVLEAIVSKFEPRLKDVKASILDANQDKERTVQFRIEAKLSVDPAPEVAFDTILELTTGHYQVRPTET
jgi:type VI secretion system protein ImpF